MEGAASGCTAAPMSRVVVNTHTCRSDSTLSAVGLLVFLLLLVSAFGPATGAADATGTQPSTRVPWPFYSTVDQTLEYLRSTAKTHSHVLQLSDELDPDSGKTLPMVTVTDFATGKEGKQVVMLVFAEHAREIITSEISLWLIRFLIGDAEEFMKWPATSEMQRSNAERKVGEEGRMERWRSHLLRNIVFKMLPIVNLEGRRKVEAGDFCLRTKLNNVDLNRNYPVGFQKKAQRSMDYGGGAPFSEPETRIIRAHVSGEGLGAQEHKPRVFVSVHSGEWALYIPWDSKMTRGEDLPDDAEALLARMNIHCKCMNGPAGKVAGYLAFGSGMDYMYSVARVPYPLTVEVYGPNGLGTFAAGGHPRRRRSLLQSGLQSRLRGAGSSPNLRCLKEFNPDTEALYQDTVAKWVGSFLNMADFLAPFNIGAESFSAEAAALPNHPKSTGKMAQEAAAAEVYGSAHQGPLVGARGASLPSSSALQQGQQSLQSSISNGNDGLQQRRDKPHQVAAVVLRSPEEDSFAAPSSIVGSSGVAGEARRGKRVPDHEPQPPPAPHNSSSSSRLQVAWALGRKSLSGWRSRGGASLSPAVQLVVYAALVGVAMSCLAVIARNRPASRLNKARTV